MKIIKINAIWCSGCLSMKKIWKEIEKEHPEIEIINYDYDLDNEKIKQYNIGTILPVTIIKNKDSQEKIEGELTKTQIENLIKKYEVK